MEATAMRSCSLGYGRPPWVFRASALYQLHLVKADTARPFIPKELKLVEAFGYTLGGFFLANYEDSPVGAFDELVVLAGLVWKLPIPYAWASRVLVNSDEACQHGRKEFGLPSQVVNCTKKSVTALAGAKRCAFGGLLSKIGMTDYHMKKGCFGVQVKEMLDDNHSRAMDICTINLPPASAMAAPQNVPRKWIGPAIKISLPGFSGRTKYNPDLLKYSCQIECRLRMVSPAEVTGRCALDRDGETVSEGETPETGFVAGDSTDYKRNLSISVMLSKPILALEFNCLKMVVEAPTVVSK